MKYVATVNNHKFVVEINRSGEVIVDGVPRTVDFSTFDDGVLRSLLIDNRSYEALVERRQDNYQVLMHGNLYTVHVADEREQHLGRATFVPPSGDLPIAAPMPGLILEIKVEPGQAVEPGDTLLILESMKMGNEIKAPRAGTVSHISVNAGDSVDQNTVMIIIS
ncbi:MAG: biotin/lipoyl-binding protein [Anaerolineae bacterium]|nr:biotin/lipoyl-binding protein [Anaerolineae bacterium]